MNSRGRRITRQEMLDQIELSSPVSGATASVAKKGKGNHGHKTLEQRRSTRDGALIAHGKSVSQPAEMLDLYLSGESVKDIAEAYDVGRNCVYNSIAKEALYRLMEMKAVERLEEIDGIEKS